MPTIAIAVLVAAVVVLVWLLWRGKKNLRAPDSEYELDQWQPRTVRPLTKVELKMLAQIHATIPECVVLPQVSLSRFLKVKSSLAYSPWFYRVGRRCVDFLVCSPQGDVLGVIELGNKNNAPLPSRGALAKERALTLASIPIWHIEPGSPLALDQLYGYIHAELGDSVAHSSHGLEWLSTDVAPRKAGIEALELEDDRWNQPWPSEDTRPTAFLDIADPPVLTEGSK
jgi:Protein of unknown function (DUF2726)